MSAALIAIAAAVAPAGGGGGGGFSHNFTLGSNGDPLSGYGGWTPTSEWTIDDGGGTVTPGMKRNSGSGETATTKDAGFFNGTFSMAIEVDVSASVPFPALYIRYVDANNWVRLVGSQSTATWHLQDMRSGSTGAPGFDYNTAVAFTPGNVYSVDVVASGTSLQAKVGGVNAGTAQTQSSLTSATRAGFGINGLPGVFFRSIAAAP